MHETLIGPLAPAVKERYYQETTRFAGLFGLDREDLPESWTAFLDYNQRMWDSSELAVGAVGREIAGYLFAPSDPVLAPAANWLRTLTAGLLPDPVRRRFGLPFDTAERRTLERSTRALRFWLPRLPARLRQVPPYFEAQRRIAGRQATDWIGRVVTRAYLGSAS
jgi:uncharacterized protein (DUF2236 family)